MDEEDVVNLTFEGELDVARWTTKAWESGHFDWNLIAGANEPENIKERWAVVRWWNDQHYLDCLNQDDVEDRELTAAIMFCFVTSGLRNMAARENVTPQDWMDLAMGNAELLNEMEVL